MALGLNVYKLYLRLESPVALPLRRARMGYLGLPPFIQATTLRGAIITALMQERILDRESVMLESNTPTIIASPAYPIVDGLESRPAHPFIFLCKKCQAMVNSQEILRKLTSSDNLDIPSECPNKHRALQQLHPSPIITAKGGVERAEVAGTRYVSVSISRRRASSVKGVLYSYEVLAESQTFWATVSSYRELDLNGLVLLLGRGASRGLGRIKIVEASQVDISKSGKQVHDDAKGVLLQSFSPLLGFRNLGQEWAPYPSEIDLTALSKSMGTEFGGKLQIRKVYGRTVQFDSGWDFVRGNLRPRFKVKAPGTLIHATVRDASGDIGLALTALRYLGTVECCDSFPITGVNMLEPMEV